MRDPGNIKYDPIQGVLKLDLLFMCQAVVEIVKHIAAEIQLCNPISHSNRKDWLLACINKSESIIFDCNLRSAITDIKNKLRIQVSFF